MASSAVRLFTDDDAEAAADERRSVLGSLPELRPHASTSFDRES